MIKIVQTPIERLVEVTKVVEVIKEVPVEKIVEVVKEVPVDRIVEVIKEVPVEKIVEVEKIIEVIKEVRLTRLGLAWLGVRRALRTCGLIETRLGLETCLEAWPVACSGLAWLR